MFYIILQIVYTPQSRTRKNGTRHARTPGFRVRGALIHVREQLEKYAEPYLIITNDKHFLLKNIIL